MPEMSSLKIPKEFFYTASRSELGFSSRPSSRIAPQRLINGQSDFYIHEGETRKSECKTLILNHWHIALWEHVLERLSAAGFVIMCPVKDEFRPLNFNESMQHDVLFDQAVRDPKALREAYCQKYEVSADQVMVVDDASWSSLIDAQILGAVTIDLENIALSLATNENNLRPYLSAQLQAGRVIKQTKIYSGMLVFFYALIAEYKDYSAQFRIEPRGLFPEPDNYYCADEGLSIGDFLIPYKHLAAVEKIKLSNSTILATDLGKVFEYAPQLKELKLARCEALTGELPDSLNLPALETLSIVGPGLRAVNLYKLVYQAPKLKSLDISRCSHLITPDIVRELEKIAPNLVIINPDFYLNPGASGSAQIDAAPTNHGGQFNLKRIFFAREGHSPEPWDYRLRTFNNLEINSKACEASQAFKLQSTGDFDLIDLPAILISKEDVFEALPKHTHEANHFYGQCTLTLNDQWQVLPSLSPEECITHLHLNKPDTGILIQYSRRDNLHYIKSTNDKNTTVEIDFNVRVPTFIPPALPDDISEQVSLFRAFASKPLVMDTKPTTGNDYLQALMTQKTGACRHRAVAFKAWMDNHHQDIPCQIVMNDCHASVEIFYNNHWVAQDLGGTAATLVVNSSNKPVSQKIKDNQQTLHAVTCAHGTNQLLKIHNQDDLYTTALALQALAKSKGQPVFRADSPDDLICSSYFVKRDRRQAKLEEGSGGRLHNFLTTYTDKSNPPLIIVNYDAFHARDIVRFNQLIDEERFADGTPVPQGAVIVGLINPDAPDSYHGADLDSRMTVTTLDTIALVKLPTPDKGAGVGMDKTANIELFNSGLWRSLLLGGWTLGETGLVFKPGAFVRAIEEGISNFVFHNAPRTNQNFTAFVDQMRLFGGFDCEGEWLILPDDFLIDYKEGFDWTALSSSFTLSKSAVSGRDDVVLNGQRASYFLSQFECDNQRKTLIEQPGFIEESEGKTLSIYLTHEIGEQAWAQLLSEAKQYGVVLSVKLAEGVTLPAALTLLSKLGDPPFFLDQLSGSNSHTLAIVTQHPDLSIATLNKMLKTPMVIDISEVDASELLSKIDGHFNKINTRFEFSEQQGALLTALDAGETVILTGEFKPELIESLAPLLMARSGTDIAEGQLILLSRNQDDFRFLPPANESVHVLDSNTTVDRNEMAVLEAKRAYKLAFPEAGDAWVGLEKLPHEAIDTGDLDLTDSKLKTMDFLDGRMKQVETLFTYSPHVFLSGLTGSGKSTFMLRQWKEKHPACYFEKTGLAAWASDNHTDELKTLFIDEANISQSEYSQFEGLYNTPPGILIDNKYYPLSKNHKVIFAGNPISYGDGRYLGSFFKRHGGSILFKALPHYVLYEEVILPIFESIYDPVQIQMIATPFLTSQQFANNAAGKIVISPRELSTMALLTKVYLKNNPEADAKSVAEYYAYQITLLSLPEVLQARFKKQFQSPVLLQREVSVKLADDRFVLTETRQKLAQCIDDLLALRAHRLTLVRSAVHDDELYGGLGGLVIEGEPGIGKSKLVTRQLTKNGFSKEDNAGKARFYIIPASMGYEVKQTMLLKAFHEGNVVLIDEINASPSMERLINSLLTGYTLDGRRPATPGFLLIGTQNPFYMAGRRKQSDAVKKRMLQYDLPAYADDEMKSILSVRGGLDDDSIDCLIKQHHQQEADAKANHFPRPCFRNLIKNFNMLCNARASVERPDIGVTVDHEKIRMEEITNKISERVAIQLSRLNSKIQAINHPEERAAANLLYVKLAATKSTLEDKFKTFFTYKKTNGAGTTNTITTYKQEFLHACKVAIDDSMPDLEKYLGWCDYLINLLKAIANAVIKVVTLGLSGNFFIPVYSEAVQAVEDLRLHDTEYLSQL